MPTESGKPFKSEIAMAIRENWEQFREMGWKLPKAAANYYYSYTDLSKWEETIAAVRHASSARHTALTAINNNIMRDAEEREIDDHTE